MTLEISIIYSFICLELGCFGKHIGEIEETTWENFSMGSKK